MLVDSEANPQEIKQLIDLIPTGEHHKWFGSMTSSQTLALSILGNLAKHGSLECLAELINDEGMSLSGNAEISSEHFEMEHKIKYLGERRQTSLDGYIQGDYQIAIECKFTEEGVGTCSRPRLTRKDAAYLSEYCNGSYKVQKPRDGRCSLSQTGVKYWDYLPKLFKWDKDADYTICPLNKNYQLVRNILAAGVRPDGSVSKDYGHAVLIYDDRNPAFYDERNKDFKEIGKGLASFRERRDALQEPAMLRKCSWQRITGLMREKSILPWLTVQLDKKYGL